MFLVQGQVLDNDMRAIPYANITEYGTSNAVSANADGDFSITVASANSQLRFTHAGYDYDTIAAGDFNSYIQLWPPQLDGATAYNNYKKSDNTGLIVLGILATIVVVAVASSSSDPAPKKVKA